MPAASAILLIPSAIALTFFFSALARPVVPNYNTKRFRIRIAASLAIGALAALGNTAVSNLGSTPIAAAGIRYNCQARAFWPSFSRAIATWPATISATPPAASCSWGDPHRSKVRLAEPHVIIVVLEGSSTIVRLWPLSRAGSLPTRRQPRRPDTLPLNTGISGRIVQQRTLRRHTHNQGAVSALTGRYPLRLRTFPRPYPVEQNYASLATILERGLGFRTAFFQSATGTFESRPGLIHNLDLISSCRED